MKCNLDTKSSRFPFYKEFKPLKLIECLRLLKLSHLYAQVCLKSLYEVTKVIGYLYQTTFFSGSHTY